MGARLLAGYEEIVDALLVEVAACGAGDEVDLSVYIIEPGASSERVVAALEAAAARGARVRVAVDWTAGSHLSRLVERTSTLLPRLEATAGLEVVRRRTPDHAKWATFPRCALVGSMNLGDRFRAWRDLAVRVEDPAALREALAGRGPTLTLPPPPVAFVTNAPPRFDVRPALEALLAWPALTKVELAMAYVDRTGAALLHGALARGVAVDLTLPARANVYHHANLRALGELMARGATARLVDGMCHAKALLLHDARGPRVAVVGSANLKRNSFVHFAEAVVVCSEPAVAARLAETLRALPTTRLDAPPGFDRVRAWVEEALG